MSITLSQRAVCLLGTAVVACVLAFVLAVPAVDAKYCPSCGGDIDDRDICLLEPLPGGLCSIAATSTGHMGAFYTYINGNGAGNPGIWGWIFGVSIGIAVLNGTVAGFQIMLGDRDSGKERFMWSTIGLLVLLLVGVILAFINPAGFSAA